jgi:hypothetical protein
MRAVNPGLWLTLGILVLLVAAVGPAHSATDTSIEQPDARWVCRFIKKGVRSCEWRYRYDEPLEWKRNPCMGGYKWKCLPR